MELNILEVELELARKIFWLLKEDYIFLGSYNSDKEDWDDGAYPAINCNDIFVPGADAEGLSAEEIDVYVEACKRWGSDAPIAWCMVKRNSKPWRLKPGPNINEAVIGITDLFENYKLNGFGKEC